MFLVVFWVLSFVNDSVRADLQKHLGVPIEKIATFKGVGWRRTIQGLLMFAVGMGGMFLFSLMDVGEGDSLFFLNARDTDTTCLIRCS
jgi:hypothetical protein